MGITSKLAAVAAAGGLGVVALSGAAGAAAYGSNAPLEVQLCQELKNDAELEFFSNYLTNAFGAPEFDNQGQCIKVLRDVIATYGPIWT